MSGLELKVLKEILKKGKIYEVGGTVRDFFIFGEESEEKDYLVSRIPMEDLISLLAKFGRVELVGKSFGVIKFTPKRHKKTYDIALPRQEFSTGVGHKDFQVTFDHNLKIEEDLSRRDFTINAIAKDLSTNQIIDPFEGRKDIQRKIIKMISPQAFLEDPLRMLRGVGFAARFEFEIEENTFLAMQSNSRLIDTVSPERIQDELNKLLLKAKKPSLGFQLMQKSGILKEILPELENCVRVDQPGPYHKFDVFEHTLYTVDNAPQDLIIRLSALFHDICKPQTKVVTEEGATFYGHEKFGAELVEKVLGRLRYSNEIIYAVTLLVAKHMFTTAVTDKGLRRLITKTEGRIFDLLELRKADIIAQGRGDAGVAEIVEFEQKVKDEIARKPPFSVKDLKVNGNDLMKKFKLNPGPLIGKILNHLLEKVLDEPEFNESEKLLKEAEMFLNQQKVKT
ncbi:MAG: hypothetical protein RBG1_1C00001G0474 [candidate division Zixibacteria bacterium RBG-1]|nr:MAG: hypothetical protein RBG1_1C00001G0474 [candidate division Zixibacteria bacterium RBG-1]OGC83461.1 MAG: hypothetical protein A2V73_01805 [candidate division Zixibacteria bacterium RBG_19FT_COMBO_42_43]